VNIITCWNKRRTASAKNWSDTDTMNPPSEELDNSDVGKVPYKGLYVTQVIRHLPISVVNGFCGVGRISEEDEDMMISVVVAA
jgi:hypothetical protein